MAYFPLFLELKGCPALVAGGGRVALGKVSRLRSFGARVTVAAPRLSAGLARLTRERKIRWRRRSFRPGDLAGARLVVAATDDQPVNESISRLARRRGIPVNVVDQPALCSFIFPSVVRRGGLVLAISTGGASPALAKWIRRDLERRYGPELGRALSGMARARKQVISEGRSSGELYRPRTVPGLILAPSSGTGYRVARKELFERALKAYFRVLKVRPEQAVRPLRQSSGQASTGSGRTARRRDGRL